MPPKPGPALSREQWQDRDYRQVARDLDGWARTKPERRSDEDPTEYVAKLGLTEDHCVVIMNRAHDRALVPPPARAALAAFALAGQPFGVTRTDAALVRAAADTAGDEKIAVALHDLADRLEALSPPAGA